MDSPIISATARRRRVAWEELRAQGIPAPEDEPEPEPEPVLVPGLCCETAAEHEKHRRLTEAAVRAAISALDPAEEEMRWRWWEEQSWQPAVEAQWQAEAMALGMSTPAEPVEERSTPVDAEPALITQASLTAASQGTSHLAVALGYAALGLPVLPLWHVLATSTCACGREGCTAPGKHPRNASGASGATTNRRLIRAWWTVAPASGIGIATGRGVDVIDADGLEALQAVRDLAAAGHLPRVLATARTGRQAGVHVLVASSGQGNRNTGIEHVDYRGRGGYVVAAPTLHHSGRCYGWETVDLLGDEAGSTDTTPPAGGWPWEGSGSWRPSGSTVAPTTAAAHLLRQADLLRAAGEGRTTTTLHRSTARCAALVRLGALTAEQITEALSEAYGAAGGSKRAEEVRSRIAQSLLSQTPLPRWAQGRSLSEVVSGYPGCAAGSVSATLDALAALHLDPASPRFLRSVMDRDVLAVLLATAHVRGSLRLVMSQRDLAQAMGRISRRGVLGAAERLVTAGILRSVAGDPGSGEASGWTLVAPKVIRHNCTTGGGDQVRDSAQLHHSLPEGGRRTPLTGGAVVPNAGPPLDLLVGARRGQARGLTRTDAALLRATQPAGTVMKTVAWAEQAGVSQRAARAALVEIGDRTTLATLGLVTSAGRGLMTATPEGAGLAADLAAIPGATGEALAALEVELEVIGAQRRVVRVHDAARAQYHRTAAPRLLRRVVAGVLADGGTESTDDRRRPRGAVTDLRRLAAVLSSGRHERLVHALVVMDGQGGRPVRVAAAALVRALVRGDQAPAAEALLTAWCASAATGEREDAVRAISQAAEALRPAEAPVDRAAAEVAERRALRQVRSGPA